MRQPVTPPPRSVFPILVGSGRSGTTLLRTIFDGHPRLAVANEPQFMGAAARQRKRLERNGFDVDGFLNVVLRNPNYRKLNLDQAKVETAITETDPRSVAYGVRAVFGVYAKRESREFYGDKTQGYVVQITELADMFPAARFVHLILPILDTHAGRRTTRWL